MYRYSICSQKAQPRKTVCCTGSAPRKPHGTARMACRSARVRLSYPRVSAAGFGAAQRPSCGLGRRRRSRRCLSRCDVMAHGAIESRCCAQRSTHPRRIPPSAAALRGAAYCDARTRTHTFLLSMRSAPRRTPSCTRACHARRSERKPDCASMARASSAWAEPACANADGWTVSALYG